MKIIISHDVDHLFRNDHYRDLIYPKLWIRSTLELLKREYGVHEWFFRMLTPFSKKRHHIPEVIAFDRANGIESTFFFGMDNGLGMSYSVERAKPVIHYVAEQGFDVGVHGIAYNDASRIQAEYESMKNILGRGDFGIRTHYVRFDDTTFSLFAKSGYFFDTSEFDKRTGGSLKSPYKVGDMWQEAIQYIVNNSLSYLIYGLLLFAAGKTLDVVQKSKAAPAPVVEAPAAASVKVNVFEEDPELTVQVNAEEDEATETVTSKVPPLFR